MPKFEKMGQNEAGYPIYERKKKREAPRDNPVDGGRRRFLKVAAGAAAMAGGAYAASKLFEAPDGEVKESASAQLPEEQQRSEAMGQHEAFAEVVRGWRMWWQLDRCSIMFVDADDRPVGEPIPFEDFIVQRTRQNDAGEVVAYDYLLTPAKKDEQGAYVVENIPGEWIRHVEAKVSERHSLPVEALTQRNVTQDFKAGLAEKDEPALRDGIESGRIRTVTDVVSYFGSKPVRGAEEYTRIEYVGKQVSFNHPMMSATVKAELRQLLPAVCAKESKFNDDLTSASGARGISQFMPATWKGLGYGEYGASEPLTKQVEAMGKHCDNVYSELRTEGVGDLMEEFILPLFPDREAFERDFLVPCMINAYNPGAGTMRAAIKAFLNAHEPADLFTRFRTNAGKDLFFEVAKFARESDTGLLERYGEHSYAYTAQIYAMRDILESGEMSSV